MLPFRALLTVKKSLFVASAALVVLGVAAGAANATTSAATTHTAAAAAGGKVRVPASGALFGAYVDLDGRWTTNTAAAAEVTRLESQLGRKLAVDHHFYAWTNAFPTSLERADVAAGRTPMITWEPFGVTLAQIASGSQDRVITARAKAMKALGHPIFLRFGHEMNGNWYPWDGTHNGGTAGPGRYVAAYRHLHDVFARTGATNVSFVWCPNAEDLTKASWNHWTRYYPGDRYVDWVAVDAYNLGSTKNPFKWQQLSAMIAPLYKDYAHRKPFMIAEAGSVEQGGNKGNWFTTAAHDIPTRYPLVRAVLAFDAPAWNVHSTTRSWNGFRTLTHTPYFTR